MKCPYCKEVIDDDSWFCDQCGKEIKYCPDCRQPRRGTECAACGADLVSAKVFSKQQVDCHVVPQSSTPRNDTHASPTMLEGDGFRLVLKEGVFGRTTGIYPEFGSQIYVSGRHGELRCVDGRWQLRDLGSHNGTFVNGVKLEANAWTELKLGDQVKIATLHFTVR